MLYAYYAITCAVPVALLPCLWSMCGRMSDAVLTFDSERERPFRLQQIIHPPGLRRDTVSDCMVHDPGHAVNAGAEFLLAV